MKTTTKRTISLLLCIAMCLSVSFSLVGCFIFNKPDDPTPPIDDTTPPVVDPGTDDKPGTEDKPGDDELAGSEGMVILPVNIDESIPFGTLSEAVIWGAPATEKVLMNVHGIYSDIVTDAEVVVNAAKGEYEAQQIIITAGANRLRYTVELSNLTSADGDVFPVENIELFHEGYVEVTKIFDTYGNPPLGWYPDALIPYEGVVATGENLVEPNCNQGLYFRFNVPVDQPHGVYEGSAKLTIGDESQIIPITLNVMNVTVSEESHSRSLFSTNYFYHRGELDSTQEMNEKYVEALFEYRLNPYAFMINSAHTEEDIEYYVERSYEFAQDPRCTTIRLPEVADYTNGFDVEIFKAYVRKFIEKSFETEFNLVKLLAFRSPGIDEPWLNGTFWRVKNATTLYRNTVEELAQEIENDDSITSPIKAEVAESVRKISHVITQHYDSELAPYIDVWCPQWSFCHTEEQRAHYADCEERWWYGCCDPQTPYPTYHTEDGLLSARLESWMKVQYGIVGNLFWATNVYARYDGSVYVDIENYYDGSALRFTRQNGDGYLFYPGKMYGVDGPIGSLRLEAIRDGLEEYELAYALKNNYSVISDKISAVNSTAAFSFVDTLASLSAALYNGTKVTANTAKFDSARELLYALAEINANTGVCILNFGGSEYLLIAPSDVTIKVGNEALVPTDIIGDYCKYTVNSLDFAAVKGGVEYDYSDFLFASKETNFKFNNIKPTVSKTEIDPIEVNGNKVTLSDFEVFEPDFQLLRLMNRFGAVDVNDDPKYVKGGKISAKLRPIGEPSFDNKPFLYIPLTSQRFGYSYANLRYWDNVSFWIYNAEEEVKTLEVGIVTQYVNIDSVVQSNPQAFTLNPGWNEIKYTPDVNEISSAYNAEKAYGLYLQFENANSRDIEDAPVFYLDEIVITNRDIIIGNTVKGYAGEEYALPDITVSDRLTGEIAKNVKVYLLNGEEKTEIAVNDGKFVPEVEGTYLMEVTATDGENNEYISTAKIEIKKANPGRVIDFDESYDLNKLLTTTSKVSYSWLESFEGESGVMKLSYNQQWPSMSFYADRPMSAYVDYDYIVIRMYVADSDNDIIYTRFGDKIASSKAVGYEETVAFDQWIDYKFPIEPFLVCWSDSNINTTNARFWMKATSEGSGALYIADIWAEKCEHSITAVEGKAATCLEDGYKAYYSCSACTKLFSDADGVNEIDAPEAITATGHSYDENKTCTSCGHVHTEKLSVVTIDDSSDASKIFATANGVSVSYVDSFEGENGVIKVAYNQQWPSVSFYPELSMSEYAGYKYIVIRMYVVDGSNDMIYTRVGNGTSVSKAEGYEDTVVFGQWIDYKFDISGFVDNWTDSSLNTNIARFWMKATNTGSGELYIADIWVE